MMEFQDIFKHVIGVKADYTNSQKRNETFQHAFLTNSIFFISRCNIYSGSILFIVQRSSFTKCYMIIYNEKKICQDVKNIP